MKKYRLIALCACFYLALTACDNPPEPSPSSTPEPEITKDSVAFYVGEEPIYYAEFNFHVVSGINTYYNSEEGQASGFDPNLPLAEQFYQDSELTMEEMFTENTIKDLQSIVAMYLESKVNGYAIDEQETESINAYFESLNVYIEQEGITEEKAYEDKYGVAMSHEEVYAILERSLTGKSYESYIRENMTATDQELEAFYEEHKNEVILPDCHEVSLRLINFTNKQIALDVLEKFENGDKSEESFIDLVGQYSTDEGDIEYGGLYTNLSPQNYSAASFDEVESWVFDNVRVPGDYSVLDTKNGYELVYFVAKGDPLWKSWSRYAKENLDIQSIIDKYPISYPEGQESPRRR
ncbi:MAG: peptidyl-prolyl cis-trans isomerase [Oscillospiraceae bacterium]|nr:peptidyl-prolyl cis-trans isomerase [Oscillospiraceae bacterium]